MPGDEKKKSVYHCPCGYRYDPEVGDTAAGYAPGTQFEYLPEAMTCPRCERAKVHFHRKTLFITGEKK